jgi:seryl-tRNA synthetase
MLDIRYIKENFDLVKKNNTERGLNIDLNRLLSIYEQKVVLQKEVEIWRSEKNKHSKAKPTSALVEKLKKLGQAISAHDAKIRLLDEELKKFLYLIPNIHMSDVPVGKLDKENKVLRTSGLIPEFKFTPRDHVELGKLHDIIDVDTSAKVAGARFNYLKNQAVLLEFALINYAFEILTNEAILADIAKKAGLKVSHKPFTPLIPPFMIKPEVYEKMARLNEGDEDKYYFEKDDIYLIGSAEHTTGPMFMDYIFSESELPQRYVAFSTAFRREAGSYGKDTRGILRVHQFEKIEMESFTLPEDSLIEQNFIVAIQEYLMTSLGLPYRIVLISTGDMGLPDARQIDLETWIPSQKLYRETHTSDLMTDYQSRRLNTKVKRNDKTIQFVHMNDATTFAIGRMLIALLENNQTADGRINIPTVLHPYLPFKHIG